VKRRDFIKCGAAGLTTLALGSMDSLIFRKEAEAATLTFDLSMEAALVEMVDTRNVFFWLFQLQGASAPSIPGPVLFAVSGDQVTIKVTNNLDEVHEFRIVAAGKQGQDLNTGPIRPGKTAVLKFTAPRGGTYMYLDPRNAPVNRVLGLHGAFIVLPARATPGNAITPYTVPTKQVQQLFNDLGGPLFPGQKWRPVRPKNRPIPEPLLRALNEGILTPTELARLKAIERFLFRTRIWVFNTVDPVFNAIAQAGGNIDRAEFRATYLPRYFLTNGKSGVFSSTERTAPETVLAAFIGQPHVVRILNAGMSIFSPHLHANHFYVLAVNNVVLRSVTHPDTMTVGVMEDDIPLARLQKEAIGPTNRLFLNGGSRVDWLVPYFRPPDIPGDPGTRLANLIPQELNTVLDGMAQSPLEYPMHSHAEIDQTAAGGNYPRGLITHFIFLGELINGHEVPFPSPVAR
jgi:FtsP/CotA-like multicopper oxidase with cupredoxin domain